MKKSSKVALVIAGALALGLAGCTSQADVASQNLSTQADNFQIQRQIVFEDTITNTYIEEIVGRCSVTNGKTQVAVTCEVAKNKFTKDFITKSDNTIVLVHQTTPASVSSYQYQIILRPSTIVPSFSTNTPTDVHLLTPKDQQTAQPTPAPTATPEAGN